MVYPALLTLVGLGSILVLLNFVVPRFASIFSESHMKIPLPTKIMLEASAMVRQPTAGSVVGVLPSPPWPCATTCAPLPGGSGGIRSGCASRCWATRLRKAETASFARAMGRWSPIACRWCSPSDFRAILNNRTHRRLARRRGAGRQARRGHRRAHSPRRRISRRWPAHLLSVGEETGRLDQMFRQHGGHLRSRHAAAIKRFTSLFEPLVILVMGVIVGALILSMLLAITSINEVAI